MRRCRPRSCWPSATASTVIRCAAPLPRWCRKGWCGPIRGAVPSFCRASACPIRSARHADADDLADLDLQPGAIVLVTVAVNVTLDGRPIQFAESRFPAERVELKLSVND